MRWAYMAVAFIVHDPLFKGRFISVGLARFVKCVDLTPSKEDDVCDD